MMNFFTGSWLGGGQDGSSIEKDKKISTAKSNVADTVCSYDFRLKNYS